MATILRLQSAGELPAQLANGRPAPALVNVNILLTADETGVLRTRSQGASRVLQGLFDTAIRAALDDVNNILELAYYAGDNAFENAIDPTVIGNCCLEQVSRILIEQPG